MDHEILCVTMIMISVRKYHCCYKFVIHTPCVIHRYYSQRQQQMIPERILILNETDCHSKNNSKGLVICIFNLMVKNLICFIYTYFQQLCCLIILIVSLYLLLLKDVRFAMVFFKRLEL